MDKIKIKENKAYVLLKNIGIHKDLLSDVDQEQWIPINKKEMKIDNVKIIISDRDIIFEIHNKGDELVEKVVKPALEKEKKEKKKIEKLPDVFPFSADNILHEYETKLKLQKFYIGEATLRKYPICETMLVKVSYVYNESRKTIKRDYKGLFISFSGGAWNKMGGGVGLVKIQFSRLTLHPDYTNIGKLRLTEGNTIPISSMSEYKGNRFYDLRERHDNHVKSSIVDRRELGS